MGFIDDETGACPMSDQVSAVRASVRETLRSVADHEVSDRAAFNSLWPIVDAALRAVPMSAETEGLREKMDDALAFLDTDFGLKCRVVDAVLAALPPTPTPGWQPMDTLPSDYWQERTTLQLVVAVKHELYSQTFGYWNGRHWQDMESQRIEPIYWLKMPPLPAPTGDRS
jgi:hypothetical protein